MGAEAEGLADALACGQRTERAPDPAEPVQPAEALDCLIGEAAIGIQVYGASDEVAEVMSYLNQFAGFRVVGDRWIIAVNTPEAAAAVAAGTDGEVVELAGTGG
jgi:hypothetical protein